MPQNEGRVSAAPLQNNAWEILRSCLPQNDNTLFRMTCNLSRRRLELPIRQTNPRNRLDPQILGELLVGKNR